MRGHLRDTRAKLNPKIKFLGVHGGVLPVIISAAVSAILITIASQSSHPIPMACLGATPFVLVFGYLLIFVTGRRPHFTRDLAALFLNGTDLSPRPPDKQPRNPTLDATTQEN